MKTQKGNVAVITLIIIVVAITAGVIGWLFVKNSQTPVQQTEVARPTAPVTQLTDETANWNTYKNDIYNFTMKYPPSWFVEDKKTTLSGPSFRSSTFDISKINLDKDCSFNINFLSRPQTEDRKMLCNGDYLGEVTFGSNKFIQCNIKERHMYYVLLHPKPTNIFGVLIFEYINNSSCKAVFEESLGTLKFN